MHNIPRDSTIKNIFVASPGKILIELDYSQVELRVLAYLSQDPWLLQVYKDGKDLHDSVALKMFGEGFTSEQRVMAKTINFGIAYGRGPQSIADTFNIPIHEAKKLIIDWYKPMPIVKKWISDIRAQALRGIACFTPFGRTRHFVITTVNRNSIENEAVNFPIQSTASDLTMFSVFEIAKVPGVSIVNTVHDSIILEADDDSVIPECLRIMAEVPQKYLPNCNLPFTADAKTGHAWGALKKWKN
jgi:DNA polymerase-1